MKHERGEHSGDRRGGLRAALATILVVDDSATIRRILRRTLEEAGYRVTEAADGKQALAQCGADRPDLLLLDFDMPVMDGPATLEAMQADPALCSLPVLFLTARTGGADVAIGLDLGAQDYLRKPCEPAELKARVASALRIKAQENTLAAQAQALDRMSTTDNLTGLGNRRRLDAHIRTLKNAVGGAATFTAITVDVDHFKLVNDTYGHAVGDLVLRVVAERMANAVGDRHVLVRWGGEEFLVVATGLDEPDVATLAEHVRRAVCDAPFVIGDNQTIAVTVSAGTATGRLDAFAIVLENADQALYEAKEHGRNRVVLHRILADEVGALNHPPRRSEAKPH